MQVRITRTKGFLKAYAKLTSDVQDRVDIALRQFVANPRHPGLHFEKYKTYRTLRVDQGRWRIAIDRLTARWTLP
ncbi:MAG: hypothetical protein QOJ96_1304 [Alphaproteobacteria bacterium]|nr:hypothetical protein [Alphaproteobacteria bacterium]